MHNAEQTSHLASAIVAKEMLYQSWASDVLARRTQCWDSGLFVKGIFSRIIKIHTPPVDDVL